MPSRRGGRQLHPIYLPGTEGPDPAVTLVSDDMVARVRALKRAPGKGISLAGAGSLAAALFAADLVDEVVVKRNPLLTGSGVKVVESCRGRDRSPCARVRSTRTA